MQINKSYEIYSERPNKWGISMDNCKISNLAILEIIKLLEIFEVIGKKLSKRTF